MLTTNANATMQDGDSDALVKERRGVNVYDGSADHDGRLWHRSKQVYGFDVPIGIDLLCAVTSLTTLGVHSSRSR